MKKTGFFLLFATFVFVILSCENDKPKIGFILPNMNSQRYFLERDEFIQKVNALGGEVVFANSNNDEQLQLTQVDSLINAGIDILVLDPVNRFAAAQIVRKTHNLNIKVISYDRLIANSDVDAYVAFDAKMTGRQMIQPILDRKPNGTYVILGGDKSDINAIGIAQGQMELLNPHIKSGMVKISYNIFIEKWDGQEARIEIDRYLNMMETLPDAIIAANDAMASGVIQALKEHNLNGQVIVTANGGDLSTCKHILDGNLLMSVYKPVKKLGSLAAELSLKMLKNENTIAILNKTLHNGMQDIPSCLLETIPMNAENIKTTVIADGMIKSEDLKK
jgi:D-xylose transport system substrate-binding protein